MRRSLQEQLATTAISYYNGNTPLFEITSLFSKFQVCKKNTSKFLRTVISLDPTIKNFILLNQTSPTLSITVIGFMSSPFRRHTSKELKQLSIRKHPFKQIKTGPQITSFIRIPPNILIIKQSPQQNLL